jgi:hypothetical protein
LNRNFNILHTARFKRNIGRTQNKNRFTHSYSGGGNRTLGFFENIRENGTSTDIEFGYINGDIISIA